MPGAIQDRTQCTLKQSNKTHVANSNTKLMIPYYCWFVSTVIGQKGMALLFVVRDFMKSWTAGFVDYTTCRRQHSKTTPVMCE